MMACVSSVLQYNGLTNTKSKPTFVLPGNRLLLNNMFIFITCLFAPLCVCVCVFSFLFACLPFYVLPLFLAISFACLLALCFFFCCMYMLGVRAQLLKWNLRRAKCKQKDASPNWAMFSIVGGLASPSGFLSLSKPSL